MKNWEIYFNFRKPQKITGPTRLKKVGAAPHSVHSGLELSRGNLVRLDDVNDGAPSSTGVAIECVGQRLRGRLEDLLCVHVLGPQSFAHALKIEITRSS